jgi:polar amino acid transport system substrate-binding protein
MKRIVFAAAVALCGVAATVALAQGSPPTKEEGKLIVGFDLPAPGFWNGRATGTTIRNGSGFEYQLAQEIAKYLKIPEVEYLRAPFGGLFSPAPKKYDFAFEEVTITKPRAKVVAFSIPYFDANQGVLVRKGLPKVTRIAQLKALQTCAQKDTTGLTWIRTKLRPAKAPLAYSASSTAAFDAVEAGRCDALILDVPIVVSQSKKKKGAYGGVAGQIVTNEFYGAVMEKGSTFKPHLDRALRALKKNGTIDRLQKKWLPFTRVPTLK